MEENKKEKDEVKEEESQKEASVDDSFKKTAENIERLEAINKEIENQFFSLSQPGKSRKRGITAFLLTALGLVLIVFFIFSVVTTRFVGSDLLSDSPLAAEKTVLDEKEQEELSAILEKYKVSLEAFNNSESHDENIDHQLVLSENQLNSMLEKIEKSKNPDGLYSLRIRTSDGITEIGYSVPFGKKTYFNVIFKGEGKIENFVFYGKPDKIMIGRLKNAGNFSDRIIRRINRFLETEPVRLGLPFLIKDMTVSDSKFHITLRFRSFK